MTYSEIFMVKSESNLSPKEIFIELIQEHQGIINKIIFLYEDNAETQEDLKQEVLLQAWKSYKNFRGDSLFSTWLYRVTLNTVLSWRRKQRIKYTTDFPKHIEAPKEEASNESELLWNAIKSLEDIDRSMITMHLDGYGNEEVANILGISVNHVGVKLHRIKKKLTQLLKKN